MNTLSVGYVYVPGELAFTEVFDVAGLDMNPWGAHPVTDLNTVLMAGSTSAQEWIGWGAHVAYWRGRALTAEETKQIIDFLKVLTGTIDPEYTKPPVLPPSTAKTPKPDER